MVQTLVKPKTLEEFLTLPETESANCITHGTRMGWTIDPDDRSIIVCQSGQDLRVIDQAVTLLPVPVFDSVIQLTIDHIFDWLK